MAALVLALTACSKSSNPFLNAYKLGAVDISRTVTARVQIEMLLRDLGQETPIVLDKLSDTQLQLGVAQVDANGVAQDLLLRSPGGEDVAALPVGDEALQAPTVIQYELRADTGAALQGGVAPALIRYRVEQVQDGVTTTLLEALSSVEPDRVF